MDENIGRNILRLRKERGMTQEKLAARLNVSFQAISKWETAQSYPDVSLLPQIAMIFETSIDQLLGYLPVKKKITAYEERYKTESYYFGLEPSAMCYETMKLRPPVRRLRLLDIGCGEGRNSVFFAQNGYAVTAFDIAEAGLEKARRLADAHSVDINFFKANLLDLRLENEFDIIFVGGVLHYIPEPERAGIIANYKECTAENGIDVLNVFVSKPFIPDPPDLEPTSRLWHSGELASYYGDWFFHSCEEYVDNCQSSGVPHRHCINTLIAEKTREV